MHYCPNCGAANEEQNSHCFACSRALTGPLSDKAQPEESLLKDRYRILTQIGSGGFGAVYRAQDRDEMDRIVAIKAINLHGLNPTQVIEATDGFNRELDLLSNLAHHHLPQIYDHFTDTEHWYLVMQYIEGSTLEYYLQAPHSPHTADAHTTRTLPLDEVLDMALQLCDVLQYLHTRRPAIIYRDLKPSNIMRTPEGQLYLIDFGIARSYKEGKIKDTIPLGSPGYAAPEQYGKAQTTPRADIYSLGALLHQLLTGIDPSETPFTFRPLQVYGGEDFVALDTLITRMINLDAEKRPASIQAVSQRIQEIVQQRQKAAPAPISAASIYQTTPYQSKQAYTNAYYKPKQTQQMMQQPQGQRTAQQSRRRFLRGAIVGGAVFGGILGYGAFFKHTSSYHADSQQASGIPGPVSLQAAYTATEHRQEMIIPVDTTYDAGNGNVAFASADETGIITFWTYDYQAKYTVALGAPVRAFDWAVQKAYLLVATDHDVYFLQLKDQTPAKKTPAPYEHIAISSGQHTSYIDIAVRPGEDYFQLTDKNGVTSFFQANAQFTQWQPIKHVQGPALKVWQNLTYSTNSNDIVAHDNNTITVWDSDTGKVTATRPIDAQSGGVSALAWSPDGSYVTIGRTNGVMQFWDYSSNIVTPEGQVISNAPITAITWNSKGQYIISTGNTLVVWDQQTPDTQLYSQQVTFPQSQQAIRSIATTQQNARALSAGQSIVYAAVTGENFVQFWDQPGTQSNVCYSGSNRCN